MAFRAADRGWWLGQPCHPSLLRLPRQAPFRIPQTDDPPNGLDLLFRPDPYILDGRYANNAWLQELPKPITKLTWDNAVHLSPKTAQRLGLENEHLVELTFRGQSVRGPVWISDGQADDTVIVHLGYGRRNAGKVGNNAGFNVYPLRSSDALWAAGGAQVRAIGGKYRLATTQTDYRMEGRDLAICEPVATYVQDPDFVKKRLEIPERTETLYPPWKYPGYSWGMSIDLTACVDCMACVIACQAENNIPVVGKEEQLVNREMHWLRVDVYNARQRRSSRNALSASAVHALRGCALRIRLSGGRHYAQSGRPE